MSATLKKAYMSGFNHWAHVEWLNGAYFKQYFEDVLVVSEKFDGDGIALFVEYLAPVGDDLPRLIAAWEEVIPKLEKSERATLESKQALDTLKRRQRAYELFEASRPKL